LTGYKPQKIKKSKNTTHYLIPQPPLLIIPLPTKLLPHETPQSIYLDP
jgi:hypothetical protein